MHVRLVSYLLTDIDYVTARTHLDIRVELGEGKAALLEEIRRLAPLEDLRVHQNELVLLGAREMGPAESEGAVVGPLPRRLGTSAPERTFLGSTPFSALALNTINRTLTPTCGAARPQPSVAYMRSNISRASRATAPGSASGNESLRLGARRMGEGYRTTESGEIHESVLAASGRGVE